MEAIAVFQNQKTTKINLKFETKINGQIENSAFEIYKNSNKLIKTSSYIISIVNDYEINLLFLEPLDAREFFIKCKIYTDDGFVDFVDKIDINNGSEPGAENSNDNNVVIESYPQITFIKDGFRVINEIGINTQTIIIKKYYLENYSDFPMDTEEIAFKQSGEYNYIFEKNYIYEIVIITNNDIKKIPYIHQKPKHYFSSIYHIKKNSQKYNLLLNEDNEAIFNLKIKIWLESKYVIEKANIIISDINMDSNKVSTLNSYVTTKVIYNTMRKNLNDFIANYDLNNMIDNKNYNKGELKLHELSISNSSESSDSPSETVKKGLTILKSLKKDLEDNIKAIERAYQRIGSVVRNKYNADNERDVII